MKKTFYALGIFVLLLTGCNSSNRKCIENEFKGKLQAHKELVEIGTKKFRINTETKNRPVYIQLWNDDKRNQILTFLNARNNSIYFYRYSDTTYLKRITFEREGANAIMSAAAYYIKSPDSIYVFNRPFIEVALTDSSGKVRNKVTLLDQTDKEWALTPPQYMLSPVAPMMLKDNHLLLPGFAPFSKAMRKREEFRFTAAIDLASNEVAYHHLYPEELFEGANWGGDLIQMSYPAFTPEGKMVHSFTNSHDLYLSDWNKDEAVKVYGDSNVAGDICSIDCGLDKEPSNEQMLEAFLGQDGYAAILHDPYRKVYYRYLLRGMPNATPKTPIDSKNLVVVMMDEQFRYLGETELGTGKEWNWTNSFVSPEGLNIEKIGTEVEDDDYLTIGIFSVRAIQE